jgi:lysylphosphatidylglycerol synthetase-like protein (DUF2156 family)
MPVALVPRRNRHNDQSWQHHTKANNLTMPSSIAAEQWRARESVLDVPWRHPGPPNRIDERCSVDMITYSRQRGGQRPSLAFAAFPDLFDNKNRTPIQPCTTGLLTRVTR